MADIFISYTQADMEKAAIVAAGFASERRTVFYDVNVAPGDSWDHRIEQELASAKAVVVLWSNASRERQWVRNEARDAMQRGVLCPALIDDCAIPIEFSHVQAADLRGMTSTAGHAGWAQLTTAVAAMLGEAAGAPSSPTESEAPSGSASGDLGLLHPAVRAAVARARDTAVMSERAAAGAREMAGRAASAAHRARSGETGHHVYDYPNPDLQCRYAGECSNGVNDGVGVFSVGAGPNAGETYAGEFSDGSRQGHGVYSYAHNAANTTGSLRYEGQYANDSPSGVGCYFWTDGRRFAGGFFGGETSGFGVIVFADGQRYEGEFSNNTSNGHGVLWDVNGGVVGQGVWTGATLTTPLSP